MNDIEYVVKKMQEHKDELQKMIDFFKSRLFIDHYGSWDEEAQKLVQEYEGKIERLNKIISRVESRSN